MGDSRLHLELCQAEKKNVEEERFITRLEAIERFEAREGSKPNNKDVSGSYFSLDIMQELLDRIGVHNTDAPPALKITGIRIWQAKSKAFDNANLVEDVVIMPTLENGSDIYGLPGGDTLFGRKDPAHAEKPLLILSSARPCPNLCATPEIVFFHEYRPAALQVTDN